MNTTLTIPLVEIAAAVDAWNAGARSVVAVAQALGVTRYAADRRLRAARARGLLDPVRTAEAPALPSARPSRIGRISVASFRRNGFRGVDGPTAVMWKGDFVGTFVPAGRPVLTPADVASMRIQPYVPDPDPGIEMLKLAAEIARLGVALEDAIGRPTDTRRLRLYQARRLAYLLATRGSAPDHIEPHQTAHGAIER